MYASRSAWRDVLVRIFLATLGCTAVGWGLVTLPTFWQQASLEYVARHIIRGEPYKIEMLLRQMPVVEMAENSTVCRPVALWSAAIIRLRMIEQWPRDGAGKLADAQQMKSLDSSIRRSLSCSPAEPFLWLVLYWAESVQNGFKPEYLKYLKMSYQLGPNEGWVVLKRNPVALADFERLPADLASSAVNEFVALLSNGFYQQAAEIFSGPAWHVRDAILSHVATLPRRNREAFARAVNDRGLDVAIPGIEPPNSKPWRR